LVPYKGVTRVFCVPEAYSGEVWGGVGGQHPLFWKHFFNLLRVFEEKVPIFIYFMIIKFFVNV
jgi:hypothetical protein